MGFFSLEEISEGLLYDPRDIKRFNEVDGYAMMFVQHGQYGKTFDEKKALKQFHDAMNWRKQNNVYGKFILFLLSKNPHFILLDISTSEFPAAVIDRRMMFYKNHDVNNSPIRKRDFPKDLIRI